jgi:hypothetical protein
MPQTLVMPIDLVVGAVTAHIVLPSHPANRELYRVFESKAFDDSEKPTAKA